MHNSNRSPNLFERFLIFWFISRFLWIYGLIRPTPIFILVVFLAIISAILNGHFDLFASDIHTLLKLYSSAVLTAFNIVSIDSPEFTPNEIFKIFFTIT